MGRFTVATDCGNFDISNFYVPEKVLVTFKHKFTYSYRYYNCVVNLL